MTKAEIIASKLADHVIGMVAPGWKCCCGAVTGSTAIATIIRPPNDPENLFKWYLWSVDMKPLVPGGSAWASGLDRFVSEKKLHEIFAQI